VNECKPLLSGFVASTGDLCACVVSTAQTDAGPQAGACYTLPTPLLPRHPMRFRLSCLAWNVIL